MRVGTEENIEMEPTQPPMYSNQQSQAASRARQPAFNVPTNEDEPRSSTCAEICCVALSWFLFICTFPFSLSACIKIVQEYERAVVFRLGRLVPNVQGPGIFFINPFCDKFLTIDLRVVSYNVPSQVVLTKDSVTISVDAVVYFQVFDPISSVVGVENSAESTKLLAQTTLRNILGAHTLTEILSEREKMAKSMQISLDEATEPWGIKVGRVEVRDVSLPQQMQRAMAAEAEASREAGAKIIAAEGELKASAALSKAAEAISKSEGAMQLRYLQTLNTISSEKMSTVIFPFPMELLGGLKLGGPQIAQHM